MDLLGVLETYCDEMNSDEEDVVSDNPIIVSQPKQVQAVSVAFFVFVDHEWRQSIIMNL